MRCTWRTCFCRAVTMCSDALANPIALAFSNDEENLFSSLWRHKYAMTYTRVMCVRGLKGREERRWGDDNLFSSLWQHKYAMTYTRAMCVRGLKGREERRGDDNLFSSLWRHQYAMTYTRVMCVRGLKRREEKRGEEMIMCSLHCDSINMLWPMQEQCV
jgi:hypothetical protein